MHVYVLLAAHPIRLQSVCCLHTQDEVELLHEHIGILNERASRVRAESASPRALGEEGQEIGESEGRGTYRKAFSVEEWRNLLAVRSLLCINPPVLLPTPILPLPPYRPLTFLSLSSNHQAHARAREDEIKDLNNRITIIRCC